MKSSARAGAAPGRSGTAAPSSSRADPDAIAAAVLDNLDVAVAVLDADRALVFANPAFARAAGRPAAELRGRRLGDLFPRASLEPLFRRAAESGRAQRGHGWPLGEPVPADVPAASWDWVVRPTPAGAPGGAALVLELVDASGRVRTEARLQQSRRLEALGLMAGAIAHDFNNVLMPIMINSELALMETEEENSAQSSLRQVLEAARMGKELVSEILSFSRPSGGSRVRVDLVPAVEETLRVVTALLPSGVSVRTEIPSSACPVVGNPAQIHQALANVFKTSAEAMQERGGVLRVALEPATVEGVESDAPPELPPGRYWRILVADSGPGMDPATADRMFDPFFSAKSRGRGTGLGLALVHAIARNHGGAVTVTSEPGRGTEFRLYLPAAEDPAAERERRPASARANERILVVDDEKDVRQGLRQALEGLQYRVITESDARSALETFRRSPAAFDLVITGPRVTGMSGIDLARRLREVRPSVAVLLCAEAPGEAGGGRLDLLAKPFSIGEVADAVRRALPGPPAGGGGGRG